MFFATIALIAGCLEALLILPHATQGAPIAVGFSTARIVAFACTLVFAVAMSSKRHPLPDSESEPLLTGVKPLNGAIDRTGAPSESDDDEEEDRGISNLMREKHEERMASSGILRDYIKSYKVLIPHIIPCQDGKLQL